jgi:hypothetical protein
MSSKKINIDPKVFNISSTTKTRSKRNVQTKIPAISPNILKNKLLKRIKEHKTKEIETSHNEKKSSSYEKFSTEKPQLVEQSLLDVDKYNNEFDDSMSLLQSLSKDKKENDYRQNKKAEINRKTVKHYSNEPPTPYVNLELPEILKEPSFIETSSFNIKPNNAVPYGNLKNGSKPTYREWNRTHRNISQPAILTTNSNNNVIINERETRMKKLREKIRQKNENNPAPTIVTHNPVQDEFDMDFLIAAPSVTGVNAPAIVPIPNVVTNSFISHPPQLVAPVVASSSLPVASLTVAPSVDLAPPFPKVDKVDRFIKRTIRKKYTLGKSKIRRSVAVLLKDNKTRKNVIMAQKELKRQPINDVKQYLREHNLIKVGSSAPNELIRKTYEYSMLAGDITNNNKDTLLHNFMKGNEQ